MGYRLNIQKERKERKRDFWTCCMLGLTQQPDSLPIDHHSYFDGYNLTRLATVNEFIIMAANL